MVAILRANPDAFVKGNINRLKNGRLLRIPTNEEVANIGYRQAMDVVREQNQAWSTNKQSAQKAVLISAAPTAPAAPTASPVEGRLTLGSADSGESNVKGSGVSGRGASLQNDLAIANDELARSTRQNEELSLRISELQAQIETMESLIAVRSDQLKALEFASKNSIDDEARASNIGSTSSNDLVTAQQPSFVETAVDVLKTNMLLVSVATLAFLVAMLVLLRLKKKPEDDLEDFALAGEEDDIFDLNEEGLDDLSPLHDTAYVEEDGFLMDESFDESVRAQTEDAVAEAEIYMSLGQEDKAIELLQKEIQENPDNADARLGLLAIYAKSQNSTGFDEQYAQLLPLGNVYANDQAMALRKQIENAELFDTDQYSLKGDGLKVPDEVDSSDLDLDLDLDEELDDSLALGDAVVTSTPIDKASDLNVDNEFSLDIDDDFTLDDEPSLHSSAVRVDDDVASDFNLDLDGDLDAELSLDDDLDTSSLSTDIRSDDSLGNDFSVQIDEDDVSDVDDF
jgi:pilus assembly protein FimV